MNDPSQMMKHSFGMWQAPIPPPHSAAVNDLMGFQNPRPVFAAPAGGKHGRINWKEKKAADKRKKAAAAAAAAGGGTSGLGGGGVGGSGVSGYRPPTLNELQHQNRMKARRFYPNKKKFSRFAPYAPRNTTSFIIRAKKSGGIASLVSPCPVTPAILPTPKFSPSREGLVDMAKEEWGVDGYGSMKGLIRLRSPTGHEMRGTGEDEDEVDEGSSESDVEEHVEVERRLDHDLSRFEMVYHPNFGEEHGSAATYLLESHVDDQDTHIAQLEEENLTLKERLFLMEREMGDLRRRLELLETAHCMRGDGPSVNAREGASDNVGGFRHDGNNTRGTDITLENEGGARDENNNLFTNEPSDSDRAAGGDENVMTVSREDFDNEDDGDVFSEKSLGD